MGRLSLGFTGMSLEEIVREERTWISGMWLQEGFRMYWEALSHLAG